MKRETMKLQQTFKFMLGVATLSLAHFAPAYAALLTNGGFETGNTSAWTVTGSGSSSCNQNFVVSNSGAATNCAGHAPIPASFVSPHSGSYAAYASFDGAGPVHHTITETFAVPVGTGSATVQWFDALGFGSGWIFSQARIYSVNLLDANNALVGTVQSTSFKNKSGGVYQNWTGHSVDISQFLSGLSGQNAKIQFDLFMPQSFTGPGVFALDDVSITAAAAVPEPGTLALLALGAFGLGFGRHRASAKRGA